MNRGKPFNPAYLHPDSIAALGLQQGDAVTITSPHDFIRAVLEADDTLRPDVIAMHHAFGGLVGEDAQFRYRGSNVGRLAPTDGQHPGAGDGRRRRLTHPAAMSLGVRQTLGINSRPSSDLSRKQAPAHQDSSI